MKNSTLLLKAIKLAFEKHDGQFDKTGEPYYSHVEFVGECGQTIDEKIVGYLHDIIEDTDCTPGFLGEFGLSKHIVDAIVLLSKTDKQERYMDYIERVSKNHLARQVKLYDLKHNMDLTRLDEITEKDIIRTKKYHKAYMFLISTIEADFLFDDEIEKRSMKEFYQRVFDFQPLSEEEHIKGVQPCKCDVCGWVGRYDDVIEGQLCGGDEMTLEYCPLCDSDELTVDKNIVISIPDFSDYYQILFQLKKLSVGIDNIYNISDDCINNMSFLVNNMTDLAFDNTLLIELNNATLCMEIYQYGQNTIYLEVGDSTMSYFINSTLKISDEYGFDKIIGDNTYAFERRKINKDEINILNKIFVYRLLMLG